MTKSVISLIAGMARGRVIGVENTLPWHLPDDMKHFKQTTLGKPVIVGRKTFESIGKPLPGRKNIIVTRDKHFQQAGCDIANSLEQAIQLAGDVPEIMIIGGAEIYRLALPLATKMYLTFIDITINGDAFFPEWNNAEWQETTRQDFTSMSPDKPSFSIVEFEKAPLFSSAQ